MTDYLLVPYGPGYLPLTPEEFATAMARGLVAQPGAVPAAPLLAEALVDSAEMGQRLGVSEEHVETLARRNEIPSVMVGRYRRFNPAQVLAELTLRAKNGPAAGKAAGRG